MVNETSKIKMIDNLNRIKKLRFNVKYLFNVSPIDKIFSKIKFDEFLEISKIDTPEKKYTNIQKKKEILENI